MKFLELWSRQRFHRLNIKEKVIHLAVSKLKLFALQRTPLGKPRGRPQIGGKYQYMPLTEVSYPKYIIQNM